MSAPDPRADLLGAISWMVDRIAAMEERLDAISKAVGVKEYLTREDIARRWGCSVSTLYQEPQRLPNYGKPDMGRCPGKWKLETVLECEAVPEDQRLRQWALMSERERREYRNAG